MKVVTRTDEYTIYRKRNQRYAVRNSDRQWVRGDEKVAVLLAHNLIEAAVPKAPDHPEDPAAEASAAEADAGDSAGEEDAAESPEGADSKEA